VLIRRMRSRILIDTTLANADKAVKATDD
jgi:hypothetical protein